MFVYNVEVFLIYPDSYRDQKSKYKIQINRKSMTKISILLLLKRVWSFEFVT